MAFGNYTNFADMLNGGGAGVSGSEFEGGGILSALANSLFSPFGSQAPDEHQHTRPQARPLAAPVVSGQGAPQYSGRGDVDMPQQNAIQPAPDRTAMRGYGQNFPPLQGTNPYMDAGDPRSGAMAQGTPASMQYGGRGSVGMPMQGQPSPEEVMLIEYLRSRGQL